MANLNRIILIGRLVSSPEVRATLDGIPMTRFKMRVNRLQGGSDVVDIIAWRRLAEICGEYLKEGQLILIEGRIQVRSFEDQTGVRRWATEIVARNMQMLERSNVQSPKSTNNIAPMTSDIGQETLDETVIDESELESDLPF